ncbi:mucin-like protein [Argonauta hians]
MMTSVPSPTTTVPTTITTVPTTITTVPTTTTTVPTTTTTVPTTITTVPTTITTVPTTTTTVPTTTTTVPTTTTTVPTNTTAIPTTTTTVPTTITTVPTTTTTVPTTITTVPTTITTVPTTITTVPTTTTTVPTTTTTVPTTTTTVPTTTTTVPTTTTTVPTTTTTVPTTTTTVPTTTTTVPTTTTTVPTTTTTVPTTTTTVPTTTTTVPTTTTTVPTTTTTVPTTTTTVPTTTTTVPTTITTVPTNTTAIPTTTTTVPTTTTTVPTTTTTVPTTTTTVPTTTTTVPTTITTVPTNTTAIPTTTTTVPTTTTTVPTTTTTVPTTTTTVPTTTTTVPTTTTTVPTTITTVPTNTTAIPTTTTTVPTTITTVPTTTTTVPTTTTTVPTTTTTVPTTITTVPTTTTTVPTTITTVPTTTTTVPTTKTTVPTTTTTVPTTTTTVPTTITTVPTTTTTVPTTKTTVPTTTTTVPTTITTVPTTTTTVPTTITTVPTTTTTVPTTITTVPTTTTTVPTTKTTVPTTTTTVPTTTTTVPTTITTVPTTTTTVPTTITTVPTTTTTVPTTTTTVPTNTTAIPTTTTTVPTTTTTVPTTTTTVPTTTTTVPTNTTTVPTTITTVPTTITTVPTTTTTVPTTITTVPTTTTTVPTTITTVPTTTTTVPTTITTVPTTTTTVPTTTTTVPTTTTTVPTTTTTVPTTITTVPTNTTAIPTTTTTVPTTTTTVPTTTTTVPTTTTTVPTTTTTVPTTTTTVPTTITTVPTTITTVPTTTTTVPTTTTTVPTTTTTVPTTTTTLPPTIICTPPVQFFNVTGATSLPNRDEYQERVCFPFGIPVGNELVNCVYIDVNGLVSTTPNLGYEPKLLTKELGVVFAPFWSDIDIRDFGTIKYKQVEKYPFSRKISKPDRSLLLQISSHIHKRTSNKNFDFIYALIVTWTNVVPFDAKNSKHSMTFQMVLVTDGSVTFLLYLYDVCNNSWTSPPIAAMGFVTSEKEYNNMLSFRENIVSESLHIGHKEPGLWSFIISTHSSENNRLQCLYWHWSELDTRLSRFNTMQQCPCTESEIFLNFNFIRTGNSCYRLLFPSQGNAKVCCYARFGSFSSSFLIRGNVEKNIFWQDRLSWWKEDESPYIKCCERSNLCDIFWQNRPRDTCRWWIWPIIVSSFGDPHFVTLDGFSYTFNGLGEFEMLNVKNKSNSEVILQVQCRTKRTKSQNATMFEAFAFKTPGTRVQVMTSTNSTTAVVIVDDIELTQFFYKNFTYKSKDIVITHENEDINSYILTFKVGATARIKLINSVLNFGFSLTMDKADITTNGLLGTYNNNTADDLQLPDNSYISINSTEETIFRKFGMLWVTNNSILYYENGRTSKSYKYPNYLPVFWNPEFLKNDSIVQFCDNNKECIFDYTQTKNPSFAQNTLEVVKTDIKLTALRAYPTPMINASLDVILTDNETKSVVLPVIYDKNLTLILEVIGQNHSTISLNNGIVTIDVTSSGNNSIRALFQIKTDKGHKTMVYGLNILVCPKCKNNGRCPNINSTRTVSGVSRYSPCSCPKGWIGDDCSVDARCAPFNCTQNSTATRCYCDCPSGLKAVDGKCLDINECDETPSPCNQTCKNVYGSYECSCRSGYKKNDTECIDVNECNMPHKCQHICENTPGNFTCACHSRYKLENDGYTCTEVQKQCSKNCSNYHGCKLNNGTEKCFCKLGYTKNATGCYDEDECQNNSLICGQARCTNTEGSYQCNCDVGFTFEKTSLICKSCPKHKWGKDCMSTCHPRCESCNKTIGCVCPRGTNGTNCEDIDECRLGYCNRNTSECQNLVGSYKCSCKNGYIMKSAYICDDEDECQSQSHNCSADATCKNTIGSYTCICKQGFSGDGYTCIDIDECAMNTSNCQKQCTNTHGSFSCKCPPNYVMADDRRSCVFQDMDECKAGTDNCSTEATCENTSGSFNCTCKEGFTGDGYTCTDSSTSYLDGTMTYIIIAAVIGCLTLLALIIFCLCFFCCGKCRRRRQQNYRSTLEYDPYNVQQSFGSLSSTLSGKTWSRYSLGNNITPRYLLTAGMSEDNAGPSTSVTADRPIPGTPSSDWRNVLLEAPIFNILRPEIVERKILRIHPRRNDTNTDNEPNSSLYRLF